MSKSILRLKGLLPLIAFLFFSAISLYLWQDQNDRDRELVLRHTETSAEQIKTRIEGLMNARIASIELVADRWVERQPRDFSQERFNGFAENLYRHYPGFTGIFYIDPAGYMQWIFPEGTSFAAKGKRISDYPDARYASLFEKAKDSTAPIAMPAVKLYKGGTGFHVLKRLVCDGIVQGYLDGVFEIERVVNIGSGSAFSKDFVITIHEDDQLIYSEQNNPAFPGEKDLHVVREIEFGGKRWRLEVDPSHALYSDRYSKNLPFLVFGLGLSTALALLIYFLLHRMILYKESRDEALREVSERKKAQEALRENEKKLEALLEELQSKNLELESFVYTVSHDLKTPIVTIEGFIGALREDFGDSLSNISEKYLKYMSDAARKMESLINDLLNLSRIGRLTEKKTEFHLAEPLKEALETLRTQIRTRGIEIRVQENLPNIYGERKRIGQVMDNLLNNAVKYIGNDNPTPHIDVGFEERNGQRVFFVRDNGIGIEEKYFDKIFHIFERLPAAKKVGDGTGIGLTIVKRIIEHHGGEIWVKSEPGKGTAFYFTLKEKDENV